MSKYAKIEEGVVTNVILCEDSQIGTQIGQHVKVTESTNNPVIGAEYILEKNKFRNPKIFTSWILNEETEKWEAPIAKPAEGNYFWNDSEEEWTLIS